MHKYIHAEQDIYNATLLSLAIYTVKSSNDWKKKRTYFTDGDFFTKSVKLERNLIGNRGIVDVGYYIIEDTLYLTYSGSEDAEFWLYNIDTDVEYYNGINFHQGFLHLAKEIAFELTKDNFIYKLIDNNNINKVVHCGHSAGAAIAGIVPVIIYDGTVRHGIIDFGAPRYLSDQDLGFKYPFKRLRFQEIYDLIACIPLTWRGPFHGFHHFGDVRYLDKNGYIDKLPWYRPFVFAWKYLTSLYHRSPLKEMSKHHDIGLYTSIIISNPFKRQGKL